MALSNEGFDVTGDVEDIELRRREKNVAEAGNYGYEEALDITGHGRYNVGLLLACFMIIVAMGTDIFGLGIIVTAATCDLGLTLEQIGVLSSMPFAGIIVMSYPWGYVSDTRGRKLVLMVAMWCSFVSAVLSSLAPNWQTLAALRFMSSAMSSAAESVTYALLGECCTARVRARYMLLMTSALMLTPTIYYIAGYLITQLDFSVNLLGIVYRPWRLLTLIMALPLGIGAMMLHFYCESPKFLVNVGRGREAIEVLKKMYEDNGHVDEFPVKEIFLEEGRKEEVGVFSLRSLWTQIAPLFKPPLLGRTLLLYYLTFVVYIANNSFAIILPTIFNVFFTSYATSGAGAGFCDLFRNTTENRTETEPQCSGSINDNTIWAGCVHGLSFFILNALISQCAGKRKILTISILVIAAVAAVGIDNTGEPISGLVLFYIFLTTAMVFGVISSYFVDLYPTSYRRTEMRHQYVGDIPFCHTKRFASTFIIRTVKEWNYLPESMFPAKYNPGLFKSRVNRFLLGKRAIKSITSSHNIRGMVACLGMMVARLSAFTGTNIVSGAMTYHCSSVLYSAAAVVLSGAVAAVFLPSDRIQR